MFTSDKAHVVHYHSLHVNFVSLDHCLIKTETVDMDGVWPLKTNTIKKPLLQNINFQNLT